MTNNYKNIVISIIIIALLAISFLFFSVYRINNKLSEVDTTLDEILDNNFSSEIQKLKIDLLNQQSKLNEFINNKPSELNGLIITLKNLVIIASLKLQVDQDIFSVTKILNLAQENLKAYNHTDIQNLRKSILVKIDQLNQVSFPDVVRVQASLQEFENTVEQLSLLDFVWDKPRDNNLSTNQFGQSGQLSQSLSVSVALEKEIDNNNKSLLDIIKSKLQVAWINFKNSLLKLITIRKVEGSESSFTKILSEEQINILKTFLKLKVTETKINLQQKNQELFVKNILDLERNINLYFISNSETKQKLLRLLNNIKTVNLIPQLPDLSSLNNELDNLIINK
ncbi:MAG: uroporphyrinogen-III C-methyltransferase [Gammaproteobacteria bacterium]|nr:uroporphyrinogen-III C-methyltransferase [Gammaproteobacteria bacterium]